MGKAGSIVSLSIQPLPNCMNQGYYPIFTNNQRDDKYSGWKRFTNKYLKVTSNMTTTPAVTADTLTRKPSKLRTIFSRHNVATTPSGYMVNALNIGSPTGLRHEGGFFYSSDAYGSKSFTPAQIPPAELIPGTNLRKSNSVKVPKSYSKPLHTRSNSMPGSEHLLAYPPVEPRSGHRGGGPATARKEKKRTKKVRWADDENEPENNGWQYPLATSKPDRHPRLAHKPHLPAYSIPQENRQPWHQGEHVIPSHAPCQQTRYTIPPQRRKPVPQYPMLAPVVSVDRAQPTSSPSTRREPEFRAGTRINENQREYIEECQYVQASIDQKRMERRNNRGSLRQ